MIYKCHVIPVTFMPGLPVLSSSTDVGNSQDSPHVFYEDETGDAVARRDGDVKASVAVQEARMGAVHFDALLVNDKHGDLSAILGGVEDLAKTREKDRSSELQARLETEPGHCSDCGHRWKQ